MSDFKQLRTDVQDLIQLGAPDEEIDAYIQSKGFTSKEFKTANENFGTFTSAVKRGGKNIGSLLADWIPIIGASTLEKIAPDSWQESIKSYKERQLKEAEATQEEIAKKLPAEYESYKQVEGVGDALGYAKEALGESLASFLPGLVTGGVGSVLSRGAVAKAGQVAADRVKQQALAGATEAAKRGVPGAAEELASGVAAQRASTLASEAAKKAMFRTELGRDVANTFIGSAAINIPDAYQSIYSETGQEALLPAIAAGSFNALLDTVTPASVLRSAKGKGLTGEAIMGAWYKRAAAGLGKGALTEGVTEGLQEVTNATAEAFVAEHNDVFTPENLTRFIDSALRGAIAGGGVQAVTDTAFGKKAPPAPVVPPPPVTPTPETAAPPTGAIPPTGAVPQVPVAEPTPAAPEAAPVAPEVVAPEEAPAAPAAFELPYRNENQRRVVGSIMGNYGLTPDQVNRFIEEGRIQLGKDGKFSSKSLDQLRAVGEIERGSANLAKALEPTEAFPERPAKAPTLSEPQQVGLNIDLSPVLEATDRQSYVNGVLAVGQQLPSGATITDPDTDVKWTVNKWTTKSGTEVIEFDGGKGNAFQFEKKPDQNWKSVGDVFFPSSPVFSAPQVAPESKQAVEPAAAPVPKPQISSLTEVETGQPFTYQGFRGAGKTAEEIYTGAKVPVAGPARYIAVSREDASMFGDQITEEPVTLDNPLVIRTDDEWRVLTKKAGWQFPNPFGQDEATVQRNTEALAQIVQDAGHDGLVIDPSEEGDMAKTLKNVFGMPQIVDYRGARPIAPEAKEAVVPAPEVAPTPEVTPKPETPSAFTIATDGLEGTEVRPDQVPNGNDAFQYAIGRVEPNGQEAVFRRPANQRGTYGGWRYENNLFNLKPEAPAATPAQPTVSPEQQKRDALNALSLSLNKPIPAFRARHSNGRVSRIVPKPLPAKQKQIILKLFGDAIDLGFPPSLLYKITACGTTRAESCGAIATEHGWLMLGSQWQTATNAERLSTLTHELGHVVDYKDPQNHFDISRSSLWRKAHQELKEWYDRNPTAQNPLSYPFSPSFRKKIPDTRTESFPQAFALYFTDPVGLQKNAPTAYSEIQLIVERIKDEAARAGTTGVTAAEIAGAEVREARLGEGPEIQPDVGEVGAGISRAERIEYRRAEVEKPVPVSPMFRGKKPAVPQRTAAGQAALDVINDLGRQPEVTPDLLDRANSMLKDVKENPSLTKQAVKQATIGFLDMIETKVFSPSAALDNAIRREIDKTTMSSQEKIGALLSISSNQGVHASSIANLFLQYGNVQYNPELYKYEAIQDPANFIELTKELNNIATKYGLTQQEAERVGHTFFEARRLNGLMEANERVDAEFFDATERLQQAKDDGDENAAKIAQQDIDRAKRKYKYIHMDRDQIDAGLNLANTIPELNNVANIWNAMRQNSAQVMIDSGLWSAEEADILLASMDYVPFYREQELEKDMGPKGFLRGLEVQAKDKKLKGSDKPVADIFDNMQRWTHYAIQRAVMNKLGQAKVNAAVEFGLATPVEEKNKGPNTVRVWENGEARFYDMQDPLFMEAFAGMESVSLPIWKFFAKMSNFLRQSVVLYPLFSVAQVPQDAFAAMFSSGLKTRYALTIPARAVKEFFKTLFKSSQVHEELKMIGATGVQDYTAPIGRNDLEVSSGLKSTPKILRGVKGFLNHISMSSDNAIRQAVYSAAIAQGLTKAEAMEKAFAIINFRNLGSSPTIRMLGQVVPFFNAYLAAQHVAIKTISGVGISPSERAEALKTLAATTGTVMALSMLYAMLMDDDEEYIDKPSVMRDRLFIIPGTGMTIPIRTDIFSMPKILTEHMYMLMTDQGMADGRKFRDSMKAALGNIVFGPTPVPQAIKPLVEVAVNYNFFQGRPLIGTFQKGLEVERQFNDSTSELAKLFGQTGLVSPIAVDHVMRGMMGSLGGLILFATNPILHSATDVPRPEMSLRDMAAALPGTSGFVSRPFETGLKNDFYVLRDEVSKVVNTFNDIKKRSPAEVEEFLAEQNNATRLNMQRAVNKITGDLTKIRQQISLITNLPESKMSASEKREKIEELKQFEQNILRSVDLKELRRIANL